MVVSEIFICNDTSFSTVLLSISVIPAKAALLYKSLFTSPLVGEVDAKRRVRGAFSRKTPLIRPSGTFSHKGRRIKFDLCNNDPQ
jgi:hypothetical protein